MQSGLQLCIGRFKARLNWRWLSKARDSYGFMSCRTNVDLMSVYEMHEFCWRFLCSLFRVIYA